MRIKVTPRKLKILDFDLENRPLSYIGNDRTSAEITAIAWSWYGEEDVSIRLLGIHKPTKMILDFLKAYDEADMVSGHYIRKHDLPLLNSTCLELGFDHLSAKLVHDTHSELVRRKDLSASQEALSAMYGLPEPKHHMTQEAWREANRLTKQGIEQTRKRVVDDVLQHKALRERLMQAHALRGPRMWNP